ncbi:MAG: hypothetical protein A2X30_07345 [Elusimicrobia bacterium GWB2_63_16]|nr:MAG: hypothetical protein A2X30_07345 [Elusimicrobia bacterium GWB2_63_16]
MFFKKWLGCFILDAIVFLIGSFLTGLFRYEVVWYLGAYVVTIIAAWQASNDVSAELSRLRDRAVEEKLKAEKVADATGEAAKQVVLSAQGEAKKAIAAAIEEANKWKQSLIEKSKGFPTLLKAIDHYEALRDNKVEHYLISKPYPSLKGSQVVKEESQRRRKAEYETKRAQALVEYYESIAPFLLDFKDEIIDSVDDEKYRDYDEEERLDPATLYLAKEEFRALPSVERNQKALDRFWARPKSKWMLGKLYERYVGYLYESDGYSVEYEGIIKGYEDLGRDLICQKGNDLVVIQCKNWAQFKTIHEKHIFQFFGTVFQYRDQNPGKKVRAIFYTTTKLSDLARRFSQELGIELKENFKFERAYPSIKCNISQTNGTRIYHLPFDQQYDTCKIEKEKGEFYCSTVREAEDNGFRRAFRYRGIGSV